MERRADIRLGILGGSTVENALRNILNLEKQIGTSPVSPKIQTNSVEIALDRLKAKFDQLIRGTQVRINLDASGLHQTYETTTRLTRGMETYNGMVSKGAELWAAHGAAIAGVAAGIGLAGKVAFDWALKAEDRMDRIKIMTRGMSTEQASAMEKWVSSGNTAWSSSGERISLLEQASMFGIRDKDAMEFTEGIETLYSKNADLFQSLYGSQGPSDLFGSMTRGLMRGGTGKQGTSYQIKKIAATLGMSPEQLFGDEFEEFKDQLAEKEEFSEASPDTILSTARAMWIGKQGKLAQGEEDTGIDVEMFKLRSQMSSIQRDGGKVFQPFFEAGLKATNAIISGMTDIPLLGSGMAAGFVFASDAGKSVADVMNSMVGPLLAANMLIKEGTLSAHAHAAATYALKAAHLAYAGGAYIAATATKVLNMAMAMNPIGLLLVGLSMLVAWLLLAEDKVKKLSSAWEWVKSIGKTALKFMISPLAIFGEGISGHLLKMVNQNAYLQRIWETLQYVWDVLVNTWDSIKKGVSSIYEDIGKPLKAVGDMLYKAFSWLFDKFNIAWDYIFKSEEENAVGPEEENAPVAEGTWGGPQFPTVQSAEQLMKFYRINPTDVYNNTLNGAKMLGSELAEYMLVNPLSRTKMSAEYGLTRFGEGEAKPEAEIADIVPALEAFTEEQRKNVEAFIAASHVLRDDDSGRVLRSVKEIENEIIAVKKGKEGRNWEDWVDNPATPGLDLNMGGIWSSRGGEWGTYDWEKKVGAASPIEVPGDVDRDIDAAFGTKRGQDIIGSDGEIYHYNTYSDGTYKWRRNREGFFDEEVDSVPSDVAAAAASELKGYTSAYTGGTVGEGGLLDVHAKERIVNAQITSRADSALETLVKMLTGGGVEAGDANRGARQVSHTHNWYFPQSVSTIGGNINWSQMQYFIEQTMHRAERQYHGD